jgi:hypothetical protein
MVVEFKSKLYFTDGIALSDGIGLRIIHASTSLAFKIHQSSFKNQKSLYVPSVLSAYFK